MNLNTQFAYHKIYSATIDECDAMDAVIGLVQTQLLQARWTMIQEMRRYNLLEDYDAATAYEKGVCQIDESIKRADYYSEKLDERHAHHWDQIDAWIEQFDLGLINFGDWPKCYDKKIREVLEYRATLDDRSTRR